MQMIDKEVEEAWEKLRKKQKAEKTEAKEEPEKEEEIEEKVEPAEESFADFEMSRVHAVHAPILVASEERQGSLDSMFTPTEKKEDEEKKEVEGPRYSVQQEAKKYEINAIASREEIRPRDLVFGKRFEESVRQPTLMHEDWHGGGGEINEMVKYSTERPGREELPFMKREQGNIREAKKYYKKG